MHKIKGLLTAIKGNEQASVMIMPYNKRVEEYLKVMKRINQVYDKVFIEPFASFINQLNNLNKSTLEDFKSVKNKPESYIFIVQIFSQAQKILRATNNEIKSYSDDGFKAIIEECLQIKSICNELEKKLNLQEDKEKELNENIKKYSKSHKSFLQAMESYKLAFQDVKLIYNIEEKTKRYKVCASFYAASVSDLLQIQQNIKLLTGQRTQLKSILEKFRNKSIQFIRIVGQQIIKVPQNIIKCLIKSNKELFKFITENMKTFKEKNTKTLFEKFRLPFPNPQYFDCELKQQENGLYPSFLPNLKSLKAEHFGKCKQFIIEYYVTAREDIKQRMEMNEKLKNFFGVLSNIFQKLFMNEQKQVKELMGEKYIKLMETNFFENFQSENNGLKISQVIEVITSFLDEQRELSKNMNKFYSQQTKQIIIEIEEENKNLLFFKDEFKNKFYGLFFGKKEFKKDIETLKSGQIQSLSLNEDEVNFLKQDVIKKVDFILMLVNGFAQKFKVSSGKIKTFIQPILEDFSKHLGYEKELYDKFRQKLESFTAILIKKRLQQPQNEKQKGFWADQNSLYQVIVQENLKIKFDSQIDKVHQFKKVKKPIQNFDQKASINSSPRQEVLSPQRKQSKDGFILPFSKNYELFVQENTNFQEGEKYVSNFTCGLCDNIIVSGRLYITTKRLFFHSRFNSSNIFFGETKLQIPRSDIKKIEKKYNAIIFDNSISVTTVNGEIFFTSLVSRDQAYDLICKTFDINLDEEVFIPDEVVEGTQDQQVTEDFHISIEQQDDMPEIQVEERTKKINQKLESDEKSDERAQQVEYQKLLDGQLQFPGINAVKVFKIFESGQQMSYKNKMYESFWQYFKGHVHKNDQLSIDEWEPNVLEFLNPSNLKKNTPLKFTRKISSNVPAPETNIPFMPKFIESVQNHELYFYSKDKYVLIIKVQNSKAPYTDCFYLRYRKIVETKGENVVKISNELKLIFVKKPMVMSMIQSKTMKESTDNNKSMLNEMQKYLKHLENTLIKKNNKKKDQAHDMSTTDGQTLSEERGLSESQLNSSQDSSLKKKLQESNRLKDIFKWGLLVSVIFNLVLLLIVFGTGNDGSKDSVLELQDSNSIQQGL